MDMSHYGECRSLNFNTSIKFFDVSHHKIFLLHHFNRSKASSSQNNITELTSVSRKALSALKNYVLKVIKEFTLS